MREFDVKNFKSGMINKIEDSSIPEDAASDSLNWITLGDHIELSGGYDIVGTENGAGKITGLKVGEKVDGSNIAIRTRGQKVEYYDSDAATLDWVESGDNILEPSDDLAGYWDFNEGSGSTAFDGSGNGNDGTLQFGSETYVTGIHGTGIDFDGNDGRIAIADDAAIQNIWDGGGTISFWIKPDSDGESSQGRIFEMGGNSSRLYVKDEAGGLMRVRFYVRFSGTDGIWESPVSIPINAWTHVMISYDADDVANDPIIYFNNTSVSVTETQAPVGTRITSAGGTYYLGNDNSDLSAFDGTIDEVRFYDAIQDSEYRTILFDTPGGFSEDVSVTFYTSLAGYQAWLSSPNSGLFKMMLANPDDIQDLTDANGIYQGYISAQNGRLHLWNRRNNKNYLYGSHKDVQDSTVYTTVTGEAIGAAPGPTYSGTLAAVTGDITCFNVVFTDGTKTMTDDKDGSFTGNVASGSINYATGAYNITFDGATSAPVTANYEHEISSTDGLADFTFTTPIRIANEGYFLPQPTGGDLLNVLNYRTEFYCIHQGNAWLFSMPVDDLFPTNEEFRQNIGMPNWRAAVATGDGIYFIDTSNPSEPRFKLLSLESTNDQVIPTEFSFNVDLSSLTFDDSVMYQWGDYILASCRTSDSTVNNRLFAYHKTWKSFDVLNYQVSVMADNDGDLWAGESSTDNVTQLFTGFSANGALVTNYWEGKLTTLEVEELKKFKRLTVEGSIGPDQIISVQLAYDGGVFQEIGTIDGTGDYVASGTPVVVGSPQVASLEIAGGGNGIEAYKYVREFRVQSTKFNEVKIRFSATSTGYASVSNINYHDIRAYGQKNLKKYRQTS
jgi:hypothetical protein|tara:strand:- start:1726 stop:4239 length:2514 start_codon:yes stop_codon:yes gene_type:complete